MDQFNNKLKYWSHEAQSVLAVWGRKGILRGNNGCGTLASGDIQVMCERIFQNLESETESR